MKGSRRYGLFQEILSLFCPNICVSLLSFAGSSTSSNKRCFWLGSSAFSDKHICIKSERRGMDNKEDLKKFTSVLRIKRKWRHPPFNPLSWVETWVLCVNQPHWHPPEPKPPSGSLESTGRQHFLHSLTAPQYGKHLSLLKEKRQVIG